MAVCCVYADEQLLEDRTQRHGGQFPGAQILGGGSRYPPNSYGQPGRRPVGTGHLPIENNGQWHSNYQGNPNSYGNYGGQGGYGGDYGHQGNYGNNGGHGNRGHGNRGHGHRERY